MAGLGLEECMDIDFPSVAQNEEKVSIISSESRLPSTITATTASSSPLTDYYNSTSREQNSHARDPVCGLQGQSTPLAVQAPEPESTTAASRKRAREGEEVVEEVEKRGCEEGMSWWTCLMLGLDQDNTKPQAVRKTHQSYTSIRQ